MKGLKKVDFIKKTIILLVLALSIAGCAKNADIITSDENTLENKTLDSYLSEMNFKKFQIKCDEITSNNINHIGYFNVNGGTTFMILNDNEVYDLNVDKLYSSTNSNCQRSSNYNMLISNYFDYVNNTYVENAKDIYRNGSDDRIFAILNDNTIKKINASDFSIENNVSLNLKADEVPLKLNGTYDFPVLKTNFGYFFLKRELLNKEDCEEFVDVKCKYEYSYELDNISDFYTKIIYYDGQILLDDCLNLYTKNVT